MQRTFIKKTFGEFCKTLDQNYKKCEIMELNMKTCITRKAEMFVRVEATVNVPGKKEKTYKVSKDFDL